MSDILDYIRWRGDLRFTQDPINPIDSLIFASFSYIHFQNIVPNYPTQDTIPLRDAAANWLALPKTEKIGRTPKDLELLSAMAVSNRFSGVLLTQYTDQIDPALEKQFSAITILIPEISTAYVAFRGTDKTIIGWKEDFNMTFQQVIPSQANALEYLEHVAACYHYHLIPGGHSKGGNLAVYAASTCSDSVRSRILTVYNHDGPGFKEQMLTTEGYKNIASRTHTTVPQASVVGMLLNRDEPIHIIHSNQKGLDQHDPYSWEVLGRDFVSEEELTESSRILNTALQSLLDSLTPEQRSETINELYEVLSATNADTVKDIPKGWLQNHNAVMETWKQTSPEAKQVLKDMINEILEESHKSLQSILQKAEDKMNRKLTDRTDKNKPSEQ